jgi:DNA-binding transcriptional regulator GbsR (MarR family)
MARHLKSGAAREAGTEAAGAFIEELGRFYQSTGMPRIAGRIVGLLLCSPEPLCALDIAARLGVARGSVSTNVRLLLARGAAEAVSYPGDRVTYYRFSWRAWERGIRAQLEGYGRVKEITARALKGLGKDHPGSAGIREYERWTDFFLARYREILDAWPVPGPEAGGGGA